MPKVSGELARQREIDAWRLRCDGASQDAIAVRLGVTQGAISQILKRVSARVTKALEAEVLQMRALSTARLDRIFSEAMGAWDESKKAQKKSRRKKTIVPGTSGSGGMTPAALAAAPDGQAMIGSQDVTVREERYDEATTNEGNFAALSTALQADAERRKLWGVNAPKKIDLLDQRRPLEKLSDEELLKRSHEADALLEVALSRRAARGAGE